MVGLYNLSRLYCLWDILVKSMAKSQNPDDSVLRSVVNNTDLIYDIGAIVGGIVFDNNGMAGL